MFGVFMTVPTGFVQVEFFDRAFCVLISKNQTGDPGAILASEALLISVSGRVGGGDIAGMAVAITLDGPGAHVLDVDGRPHEYGHQSDRVFIGSSLQASPVGWRVQRRADPVYAAWAW